MLKKMLWAFVLVAVAVGERIWWDLGPNVELITLISVMASIYLGKRWGILTALAALIISDQVIGNTNIFLFTWSGFAVIGWAGWALTKLKGVKRIIGGGLFGLVSAVWFYLYTNFGVWLISQLYPPTWQGLLQSYYMGLPFLKIHAVSNLLLLSGAMTLKELTALTPVTKLKQVLTIKT